jgi:hypothetical protein
MAMVSHPRLIKLSAFYAYTYRELSSRIREDANVEALKRLEVYKEWFLNVVMKTEQRNTLVIIPIEEISPRYRDELPTKHFDPVGVPNLFLSPILKAPELTIPSEYVVIMYNEVDG